MPFSIIADNNKYAVMNTETGKTYGYTTKQDAEAQLRILEALYKPKCLCIGRKKCPN